MAMERPTPVSSLLHSSTIVVARVILSMMLGGSIVLGITTIIIMSMFLPSWFDGKKIIALSTSVHLAVMFLSVSIRMYGVCLIHILTHAFVKATCFVASGVKIGMTGSQELR
jgi:NADH-ubiquinone oxidoreductase chain 5